MSAGTAVPVKVTYSEKTKKVGSDGQKSGVKSGSTAA